MAVSSASWIGTSAELDDCCMRMSSAPVLGLDTEFIGETTFHPQLCLIQVAIPGQLFAIDPFTVGSLDQFWAIVTDPNRAVVVHAGREELRMCQKASGRVPHQLFDTQIAAGLVGIGYPMGYASLVQQALNCPLSKGETLSDWSRRPLTPKQLAYAFDDVRYLLPLHEMLSRRLTELRRVDWLAEESQALKLHADLTRPEHERWRKLRGIGALDRKRLAVVRELFEWRDAVAQRLDRPARSVLRDDVLVEIARRQPQSERDLAHWRGLPQRDRGEILGAVLRGRETRPENWPAETEREIENPTINALAGVLQAVLFDLGTRWSLIPGLVATSTDVRRLVRSRSEQDERWLAETAFDSGWRAKHVLPVLDEVLTGRRGVRIGDVRRATPLDWDVDGPPPIP